MPYKTEGLYPTAAQARMAKLEVGGPVHQLISGDGLTASAAARNKVISAAGHE